ncbi:MAG: PAS domain S-box protein, partial [Rhodothermales bacterium]|nr:PAS domain S-box protein [Rhodothermales bacterium]
IIAKKERDEALRIWVPGCATGEEAFSIATLVAEALGSRLSRVKVQIYATDVDLDAIAHARKSVYLKSQTNSIPQDIQRKYFESLDGTVRVRSIIRDMVVFADHDLLQDPPFSRLDLISCRNVLIYFRRVSQERLLAMFHYSLNPGGYLLLGASEGVGQQSDLFAPVNASARLYMRKVASVQTPHIASRIQKRVNPLAGVQTSAIRAPDLRARDTIFNLYSPPGVLVNEQFEVVYIHGDLERFLALPRGIFNMSLLELAATPLRLELRLILQKSRRERRLIRSNAIEFKDSTGVILVTLVAIPVETRSNSLEEDLQESVVLFETRSCPDPSLTIADAVTETSDLRLRELEQELTATREHLQNNIEDLEVANEELQATNEELQSTTEELQSANEEFQSTNEELQSTNEELQTVNEELSTKSKDLGLANADLESILNMVTTAIIVLDQDTRVTRYSAGAKEIADLLPTSIGRPVATIGGAIDLTLLSTEIKDALKSHRKIERELELGSRLFLVRIQPVDTPNQHGLIISFNEETERLEAERVLRRLASVVRDSYDAIIVRDMNGQILEWNRGASRMYGYSETEARDLDILQIVPEALKQQVLDVTKRLMNGEVVEPYEETRLTKKGNPVEVWVTASAMYDEAGVPYAISTTERDLADRKMAKVARQNVAQAEARLANSRYAQLTSREREILVMLVEGSANASSRQIGVKLGISPRTVDTHRRRIKKKMHAHSQADLRDIAILCGALDPDAS